MSEMRLRHKKPINSYVGQANYDSNQAQDEDFANKNNPIKKTRFNRPRPTNQQTKKYAQILCQFVNTVNQDYRNHIAKPTNSKPATTQEEPRTEQISQLLPQRTIKDTNNVKAQEVVSKQQQKIRKSENINNKNLVPDKKNKRELPQLEQRSKNKETKEAPIKAVQNIIPEVKNPTLSQPMQLINSERQKSQQQPLPNMNYNPQLPAMSTLQQLQQIQQIQQMFQNSLYGMNGMNPALYSMYPYAMNPMLNYQLYLEQMKADPYFMQNLMGMFQPNPNLSTMLNNGIPFSKLPFNRMPQPQPRKEQVQPQKAETPIPPKPQIQSLSQTQTHPQPQHQIPPENKLTFLQQQAKKKLESTPESSLQPIDFKRKSCYHIAIAYNIHFARLKQKGLFNNMNSAESFEKLDPTFPAKKVRQRKKSQGGNINDTSTGHL